MADYSLADYLPGGGFFSRDVDTATGHARRHQANAAATAREFRLNLQDSYRFHGTLTEGQRDRIVAAVADHNPRLAADIRDIIDDGTPLSLIYQALEHNTPNAGAVLRRAGFNSVDTGRDVLMLSGHGIRSADAVFDPSRARSQNIYYGIPLGAAMIAAPNGEDR